MIMAEAIIVIQMQNKNSTNLDIALTTYCSSLNVETPLKGCHLDISTS